MSKKNSNNSKQNSHHHRQQIKPPTSTTSNPSTAPTTLAPLPPNKNYLLTNNPNLNNHLQQPQQKLNFKKILLISHKKKIKGNLIDL
jgi:hypothetical protein